MRNILLNISYDGSAFCGWQKQLKNGAETQRTVQGELEKALSKLHKHPVQTNGSGRTDSGVHAFGQAVNFFTDIKTIKENQFLPALNSILPHDIRVMNASSVHKTFHARFNALSRTYRYFICCSSTIYAHETPYCWHTGRYPDIEKLNCMAKFLHGETDCTAFSAAGDQSKSKSRYIKNAVFFMQGNRLVFEISANAFLWKMVRAIVGTLIQFEKENTAAEKFKEIIEKKDRGLAGITAPAKGLFLWSVEYPEDIKISNNSINLSQASPHNTGT